MSLQRLALIMEFGWLAAAVGAHGAVLAICLADHATGGTAVGMFAAEILRLVQLAILSLWLILGPGPKRLRWIAIPGFVGLLYAWSELPYPSVGTQTYWLGLTTAGILIVFSLAARLGGGRVRNIASQPPLPPVQFSIRGLLITTTLAALLVAGGKWVYANIQVVPNDNQPDLLDLDPSIARSAVALGIAMISLAAWWAVFRPRRVWLSCLLVAAVSSGCGMLMTLLLHEEHAWLSFGLWWLLHAVAIMATLAPLRQMGFRWAAKSQDSTGATAPARQELKIYGADSTFSGISS
jgi:hypothetical protein